MLLNLFYVLLAILGLSFLIFIHELGHYWMARRVGMRVEVFSIGFGKPLYSWVRDGVRWQIGWLLFGGYVKILGQEVQEGQDPIQIPEGFFAKSPLDRIKVAFMGPFVNLLFAFLVFGGLWAAGGREKNFSEFTHKIGWLDPHSELYQDGVRPGDEIVSYDGRSYESANDNLYAPMIAKESLEVKGFRVDDATGHKTPFAYNVKVYPHPASLEKGFKTVGILSSANYIIYNKLPGGGENPLPEGSPLLGSGIVYGDRIVWVNGMRVFSSSQLNHLLNDNRALLSIQRGNELLLRRVPRVQIEELKLTPEYREELTDWQFEANIKGTKLQKLYAIPYNLTHEAIVETPFKFIDKEVEAGVFPPEPFSQLEQPLQAGDKIVAIDGTAIKHASDLLKELQSPRALVIVERPENGLSKVSWKEADIDFDTEIAPADLEKIVASIGSKKTVTHAGNLLLLKPIVPKMRSQLHLSPEKQAWIAAEMLERKKEIESIEDPEKRAQAMSYLESREKQLLLGLPMVQDRKVTYNPAPFEMFSTVFQQIWRTLSALFTGSLNPKWISGPIGIVQIVHDNWMHGIREALYWLGAISLNLGFLNLLPIPVLDGGSILISGLELITRRRLHPKTLEKIIIPFAVLLVGFFIFLTYNDLSRLFGGFFRW